MQAATIAAVPMIGFAAPPADAPTLTGEAIAKSEVDLTARFLSNGQPHRALPLTASAPLSPHASLARWWPKRWRRARRRAAIRIGMPSGILAVGAVVEQTGPNTWIAQRGSFFRTTRRLFDGRLCLELS